MASFFFWFFVIFFSLIAGAIVILIIWFIITSIIDLFIKLGIPRRKIKVSEYLTKDEIKAKYKYPGLPTESEKEVYKENERKRNRQFREFEKLRREEFKRRIRKGEGNNNNTPGSPKPEQSKLLQNELNRKLKDDSVRNPGIRKSVKLDE